MKKLKKPSERGKFIVLYGSNNLGKSTQIKELADKFVEEKKDVLVLKYPIYNLKPTGPKINKILRTEVKDRKSSIKEDKLQQMFAQNRKDFQQTLIDILNSGINVIAEDYKGTGIAWGRTRGVSLKELEKYNKGLIDPDVSILLDGKRFSEGKEKFHRNEGDKTNVWERNRQIHLDLAKKYEWNIVNANDSIENVNKNIWKLVEKFL